MAFDPDFARKDTRQFVSGGRAGKLILNSKGFLGFGSKGFCFCFCFLIVSISEKKRKRCEERAKK